MTKKRLSLFSILGRRDTATIREPLSPLVKRIFLLSFLSEFIVLYPFYVIMFGERGNISAAGVGTLLAAWMIVSVLAEVPTGIIADKMSKKWSLVLGRIGQLATFVIWLLFPNFWGYLTGFIVWGIGEAFTSGAFQAYLYESLDEKNKRAYGKIFARSSAFTMLAYATGSLAAFAIGPQYQLLIQLSILVSSLSLLLTISLPKTHSKQIVEVEIRPKILRGALAAIRTNPLLLRLIFIAVITQSLISTLGEYLPAYYQQVGTPTRYVALIISIGSAVAMLMYWWVHALESLIARYQILVILGFTGLYALSFWGGTILAVAGFFVFTRMLRVMSVHNESQVQHHAPDESRATLGSVYAFVGKIISAGILGLVGLLAVDGKIVEPVRYISIGMMLLAVAGLYFARSRQAAGHT